MDDRSHLLSGRSSGAAPAAERIGDRSTDPVWRHLLVAIGTVLALLVAWQLLSVFKVLDPAVVARPTAVVIALWNLVRTASFWTALRTTLLLTIVGYVVAVVLGGVLGAVLALSSLLQRAVGPYILALRSLPVSLVAPLFIAWFGFGYQSKVATAVSLGFFPMMINTMVGLRQMSEESLTLMRSLRSSRWQVFRKLRLPSALPFVFVGLKHSLLLAFSGVLLAEILIGGSTQGLGTMVREYMSFIRMDVVFALTAVAVSILVVLVVLFDLIEQRVIFWTRDPSVRSGIRR